jgi:hypothetical protein
MKTIFSMHSAVSVVQCQTFAAVMRLLFLLPESYIRRGMRVGYLGKPEGKRPLGRLRRRWVDNIKMDLGEIAWGGVGWIGLSQDRDRWRALVNAVINLRVP